MSKTIVAFQVADKSWRIKVDGKKRDTWYKNVADIKEFVGACQAHGMFEGYKLYVNSESGMDEAEPTYNNPCLMPVIAEL